MTPDSKAGSSGFLSDTFLGLYRQRLSEYAAGELEDAANLSHKDSLDTRTLQAYTLVA